MNPNPKQEERKYLAPIGNPNTIFFYTNYFILDVINWDSGY
jgi:hypothetical protein